MDSVILLFGTFAALLVLGVPIAFALGLSSLLIIWIEGLPISILAQTAYRGLDNFILLAVPFFLIVGVLMNVGTITERLLDLAGAMFGKTRGALAKVNIVASMLFAGLSGSSVADVAGIGSVLIPAMIKQGYPRAFAVAVTAASSTIGIIIPPSIFLAVYGAVGDVSIGALFLGGAVPGLLIGATQLIYCHYLARTQDHPRGAPFSFGRLGKAAWRGALPFGVTVVILGGIIGGIFTATEAAAVAVLYVLALAGIGYRALTINSLRGAIMEAAGHLGPTMLCVAMGAVFAWVMAFLQVPQMVGDLVKGMDLSPTMVLLFIMVLFVIVGTFESGVASIIIFLPIIQPMADAAGLHPVHVGVIVCVTLALGLITPPYGLCLFIAARIGKMSVDRAFVATLPWIVLFLAVDVILVLVPDTVLLLPRLVVPEFMGG
ncbi:MAG TPA: TRAP transporter large permease [Alphaproteobacteria bacterium]